MSVAVPVGTIATQPHTKILTPEWVILSWIAGASSYVKTVTLHTELICCVMLSKLCLSREASLLCLWLC